VDVCQVNGVDVCQVNGVDVCQVNGVEVCQVNGVDVCQVNGVDVRQSRHQEVVTALCATTREIVLVVRKDPQPPGMRVSKAELVWMYSHFAFLLNGTLLLIRITYKCIWAILLAVNL
jgi:hypothetical protein